MTLDNIKKEVVEIPTESSQKTFKQSTASISATFKLREELKTVTDIQRDSGSSTTSSAGREGKQPLPPGEDAI